MARAGAKHGFGVEILDKVESCPGETISSSTIRHALERGEVADAALRLGRPYAVTGLVIRGRQLGRTLDMPTANLAVEPTNRLAFGVYAVRAVLDGVSRDGVASFGVRPTVDGVEPLLETFIFDFSGDIYGRELTVEIVARIRDELKFSSLEASEGGDEAGRGAGAGAAQAIIRGSNGQRSTLTIAASENLGCIGLMR